MQKIFQSISKLEAKFENSDCIKNDDEIEKINTFIVDNIFSGNVNEIYIICYGTNAYGQILSKIRNSYRKLPSIKIHVLTADPNSKYIFIDDDRKRISDVINSLKTDPRFDITTSNYLPTIRACLLLDKNTSPLFSCIQPYRYNESNNGTMINAYNMLALAADTTNRVLLHNLSDLIKNEFNRLGK